jgi:hypothetical protein
MFLLMSDVQIWLHSFRVAPGHPKKDNAVLVAASEGAVDIGKLGYADCTGGRYRFCNICGGSTAGTELTTCPPPTQAVPYLTERLGLAMSVRKICIVICKIAT